jgi:BASS family bile acid:Na+ symporter
MTTFTRLFPLWALALSAVALFWPSAFTAFKPAIIPLLMVIMFSMGLTLDVQDFRRVLSMPKLVITGLLLQYTVMPLAALAISMLLQFDPMLSLGFILLGSCPGGTASNVITYLARGNVALSITLTACSTVLAVILTPAITYWLADASIHVPAMTMLINVAYMVIFPVSLGLLLKHFFAYRIATVSHYLPALAVAAIVLIIAIITALNHDQLSSVAMTVFIGVVLHNLLGLGVGYFTAGLLGVAEAERRTLAIEVGMQNSGLAVALAIKQFTPMAALPGALFSIWHNLSGSALAYVWSGTAKKD